MPISSRLWKLMDQDTKRRAAEARTIRDKQHRPKEASVSEQSTSREVSDEGSSLLEASRVSLPVVQELAPDNISRPIQNSSTSKPCELRRKLENASRLIAGRQLDAAQQC